MSWTVLRLVDRARIESVRDKSILRTIASQSNDNGSGVWSSKAYIAWCTGYSERAVQYALRALEVAGLLDTTLRAGTSSLYRINVPKLDAIGEDWTQAIEVDETLAGDAPLESTVSLGGEQEVLPKNKEEPTYINDVGGAPSEVEIEFDNFLKGWKTCFPDKPQPRRSSAFPKFRTRFKDGGFRTNWKTALWRTRTKRWAHTEGWFKWQWFLHNNYNYEKLLDGTFDFKDKQTKEVTQPDRPVFVDARPEEAR